MSEKKCPNSCGNMIILEQPSFVPPPDDAMEALSATYPDEDRQIYTFIDAICPKCGFYECHTQGEAVFEAWRKNLAFKEKEAATQ